MLCDSVERNAHFRRESFFGMSLLFDVNSLSPPSTLARTALSILFRYCVWQHQSMIKYKFDDYIFACTREVSGKTPH